MAIIPNDEKVFMVDKTTNTRFSGSAATKAMQEWYTMQDVIDTVGSGLKGSLYVYVAGKGTDVENAAELQAAYNKAKTMSPSVNNTITVLIAPGEYNFGTNVFLIDTQYINVVSLDGNRSVIFNYDNGSFPTTISRSYGSVKITANNIYVKGLNTQTKALLVESGLNNLTMDNCVFGQYSIGGFNQNFGFATPANISGKFNNCEGSDYCFAAGLNSNASGTFNNCISNYTSFGGFGGYASGTFNNCKGGFCTDNGTGSGTFNYCRFNGSDFGGGSPGTFNYCIGQNSSWAYNVSGTYNYCTSGSGSWGSFTTGAVTGKLNYCKMTVGTFKPVGVGGITRYCLDGNNATNNQG